MKIEGKVPKAKERRHRGEDEKGDDAKRSRNKEKRRREGGEREGKGSGTKEETLEGGR